MKAYHRPCGSNRVERKPIANRRTGKVELIPFCMHCRKKVEEYEIQKTEPRLSAITFNGKTYIYGRECK